MFENKLLSKVIITSEKEFVDEKNLSKKNYLAKKIAVQKKNYSSEKEFVVWKRTCHSKRISCWKQKYFFLKKNKFVRKEFFNQIKISKHLFLKSAFCYNP